MKIKMMIIKPVHHIWHFITGPSKSNPLQLIMMQPMMSPMMPKRAVEAPALTGPGLTNELKMFPAMPDTRQIIKVLTTPKVYSILDKNMKVVITFPKMCMKLMCMNTAERYLQNCSFLTNYQYWQFPPQAINVVPFICSRLSDALSSPTTARNMKTAMSANTMRKVRDRNLKVGHREYASMSQQFSSLGFFKDFIPETNSMRCS